MDNEFFQPVSDMELRKTIANKIRVYRKSAGLTQKQLAELSGVSIASVQRIERSNDALLPGVSTLLLLTNAMHHELADVFI